VDSMNNTESLLPILFTDTPPGNGIVSDLSDFRNHQVMFNGASPSDTKHVIWADWPENIGSSKLNGTIRGGTVKQPLSDNEHYSLEFRGKFDE